MDDHRFDTLARALRPANRRSLLGGAISGVLGITALVLGQDESSAANNHNKNSNNNRQRRRGRRNRRRTWKLQASPLTFHNETPSSGGDKFATSACSAQIKIIRRRNRYQICGNFTYTTKAVANPAAIDVRNVIIQTPDTAHSTTALVTFLGWKGTTVSPGECKPIREDVAKQILRSPWAYYANILTNNPSHHFGAVAAPLVRL
jgi:hypothetical protein